MTKLQAIIARAGVTPQAAHAWQKAAAVEDAVIENYIAAAKATCKDITVAGLLQWARDHGDDGHGDSVGGDDDDPPTHACPTCGLIHEVLPSRGGE